VKEELAEVADDAKLAKPPLSVEALEEALLAGLNMKKGVMKKPAASVMKKPAATKPEDGPPGAVMEKGVMKKPAASVVLKRPAAGPKVLGGGNIDMSGIFAKLRARKGTMSRKGFTSMAYHNAKTLATSSGFSAEKAKVIARGVHAKASALYDRD
jgi:hypothetical protein